MRPDPALPEPVHAVLKRLREAGHPTYVVGGCLRDAILERALHDFDVTSAATREQLLRLLPHAIPIGRRHGTVMAPTAAGPVDITPFRHGSDLLSDLSHRDFTFNAIAFDPAAENGARWIDPHGGVADLVARTVRAVGDPRARLAEDPLRALRAMRFASQLEADLDPALAAALPEFVPAFASIAAERIRAELEALLLGRSPDRGLALLARSGLGARLAPGTAPDVPAVVAALPRALPVRLLGWLRYTEPGPILGRLRFPRRVSARIEQLVRYHPIHLPPRGNEGVWARRTLARLGAEGCQLLLAVAEAERSAAGIEGVGAVLDATRSALEQAAEGAVLGPAQLAISGHEVMGILGCAPGPMVGQALAYLTERVLERPEENTTAGLRALLATWGPRGEIERKL